MLVVIGGFTSINTGRNEVSAFNFNTETWSDLPSTSVTGRLDGACGVLKDSANNNEIVVAGGLVLPSYEPTDSVEIYSFASNSWRSGPTLPNVLGGPGYLTWRNSLLVMGGTGGSNPYRNEILQFKDGQWTEIGTLPDAIRDFGAVLIPPDLSGCS